MADIILIGTGTGEAPLTYLWTTGDGIIVSGSTTRFCTVRGPGTYTFKVTSKLGAFTTVNHIVVASQDLPIISIVTDSGGNSIAGGGGDLVLTATPSQGEGYAWYNSAGEVLNIDNTQLTVTEPDTYTFKASVLYPAVQGCFWWTLRSTSIDQFDCLVRARYKDCNNVTQVIETCSAASFCAYYVIEAELGTGGYQPITHTGLTTGLFGSISGGIDVTGCETSASAACTGEQSIIITA